jgi:hypothetical protein
MAAPPEFKMEWTKGDNKTASDRGNTCEVFKSSRRKTPPEKPVADDGRLCELEWPPLTQRQAVEHSLSLIHCSEVSNCWPDDRRSSAS